LEGAVEAPFLTRPGSARRRSKADRQSRAGERRHARIKILKTLVERIEAAL